MLDSCSSQKHDQAILMGKVELTEAHVRDLLPESDDLLAQITATRRRLKSQPIDALTR